MRRLVWFAIPFALAVLLSVCLLSIAAALALAGLAGLGLLLVWRGTSKRRRELLIALGGLCAGLLFCTLFHLLWLDPVQSLDGTTRELTATVCGYPEPTRFGCRVEAELPTSGRPVRTLLYLDDYEPDLSPGDRVTLRCTLKRSDLTSDGEETLYYQSRGIRLLAYPGGGAASVAHAETVPARFWPTVFSHRLGALLEAAFPVDAAGLMRALLTGDRSGLRYAQMSDFKMAGVSHLVAISGMHVSILLGFLALLCLHNRRLTALLGIPVVIFFVFSTGCSPSVIRAAVMQILFLLAPLLWRENDPPTSLCAALLLLLLQNPYAIADLSLWLSFGAMGGILLVSGPIYRRLAETALCKRWLKTQGDPPRSLGQILSVLRRGLTKLVLTSLATTLGAQLFTAPIVAWAYGSFSVYMLLSNLIILWAVSLSFLGGLVSALLGWVWLPLGQFAGRLFAWPGVGCCLRPMGSPDCPSRSSRRPVPICCSFLFLRILRSVWRCSAIRPRARQRRGSSAFWRSRSCSAFSMPGRENSSSPPWMWDRDSASVC